jgi:hypothetical protein
MNKRSFVIKAALERRQAHLDRFNYKLEHNARKGTWAVRDIDSGLVMEIFRRTDDLDHFIEALYELDTPPKESVAGMQIDADQQMTPHGPNVHLTHMYCASHKKLKGTDPMTTYQVTRSQIIRVNDVEERIVYAVTAPTGQVSEVAWWEGSHVVCLTPDCDGAAFCSRAHCDQPHRHEACEHVDAVINAVFEGRVGEDIPLVTVPDQLHDATTTEQPPSIVGASTDIHNTPAGAPAMSETLENTQTPEDSTPGTEADAHADASTPAATDTQAAEAQQVTPATKYAMFIVTKIEGAVKVSLTVDGTEVWSNLPNPKGNGGDKSAIASGKQRAFKVCERRGYVMVDVAHQPLLRKSPMKTAHAAGLIAATPVGEVITARVPTQKPGEEDVLRQKLLPMTRKALEKVARTDWGLPGSELPEWTREELIEAILCRAYPDYAARSGEGVPF